MIATLIATLFAGAALFAVATMVLSWRSFGFRFQELQNELRTAEDPVTVRFTWRETASRPSAMVYNLDFRAKSDALPFRPELLAAA